MARPDEDVQAYLARIRKTIADSEHLVSQAKLRIDETDRMLEKQGLTREQVLKMHFSKEQMEAVNAELKRRGMDPLDEWSGGDESYDYQTAEPSNPQEAEPLDPLTSSFDAELAERQKKFGMMMKPFQI